MISDRWSMLAGPIYLSEIGKLGARERSGLFLI